MTTPRIVHDGVPASVPVVQAQQTSAWVTDDQFSRDFRAADERPTEVRYAERVTSTQTITPTAGKAIRLRKIGWLAQDNPNSITLRWADVGSGVKNIWKAVATQQTVYETGEADRPLEIVTTNGNPVDVNVHYEEITP